MSKIGFIPDPEEYEHIEQPEVIPLYVDDPDHIPGWWDDDDDRA